VILLLIHALHAFLDRAPDFDESIYMDLGRNIVRTGQIVSSNYPPQVFLIHPPLFYYLVSLSFAIFGPGLEAGRLVSTLMGVGCVVFVFFLLKGKRNARWAAAVTLLLAVNPAFLYYGHSVYMEMTVAFWLTGALWCYATAAETDGLKGYVWTGAFLGLACLTKYYSAVMVVVMALAVLLHAHAPLRRRLARLLALLGPLAVAGAAWIAWGLATGGQSFIDAQISWNEPDMSGASYSWRHVTNAVFLREIVGVITPVFALLALFGMAMAGWRLRRLREYPGRPLDKVLLFLPLFYCLFLVSFREKDVKYIVPLLPALAMLIGLGMTKEAIGRIPPWVRWSGVLIIAGLASPLVPLLDPWTGQRHDNLWVFCTRRDAEYRRYRDAGVLAGAQSSPGQVVACQRKGPIVGYFADRPYLDFWGFSPERARSYLDQAEIVVLDAKTEYLTPAEKERFRRLVETDFHRVGRIPVTGVPVLEIFRRRGGTAVAR
jgi:4-amino-4-deoxy-L-arabinose transferase-like glycosyltransferase